MTVASVLLLVFGVVIAVVGGQALMIFALVVAVLSSFHGLRR